MTSEPARATPVAPLPPQALPDPLTPLARAARALSGAEAAAVVRVVDGMVAAIAGDPLPTLPLEAPFPQGVVVHLVTGASGAPIGGLALKGVPPDAPEAVLEDQRALAALAVAHLQASEEAQRHVRTEHQLAQAERLSLLGGMVSGIAHEVRTPLTYAATNLYLLQRALSDAEAGQPLNHDEAQRRVVDALDGVDRINHLLGTLRRYVRQENAPVAGPVPLHEAVREAVDLFCATRRGQVEVTADLAPVPAVRSDRRGIHQVALNLLNNAAEAMPGAGRIRVATRSVDGAAELVVTDEGPGMAPEVQARIFDEFYTTKPQGTGLGLSIVRRIVEAAGGRVTGASTPGKGTTFVARFPAA